LSDPVEVLSAARRELRRLPGLLDAMVGDLEEATARARPAPGEWAPVEILCHLRDEETEDFGARLRAVLEGKREFAPIDPVRWVEERRYREARPAEVLEAIQTRRRASLELLAGLAPERLVASVPHASFGRLSGLDLLVAWVEHDRLHLRQLAGALARLWASRWAPLKAEYAGPIPHARAGED
jgi:hypothetical protein